jgi:hypothetical protein
VEKLILDIRYNSGGDGSMLSPLIHGLIQRESLNQPGKIYVLVGRKTFSAAVMLMAALTKECAALFAGEPAGAGLNHFGDVTQFRLPNSGLTVSMSTIFWQLGWGDTMPVVEPVDIPAVMDAEDFYGDGDSALETVLGMNNVSIPKVFLKEGKDAGLEEYYGMRAKNETYEWWRPFDEDDAFEAMSVLIEGGQMEDALALGLLAAEVVDSSKSWEKLGDAYMEKGEPEKASAAFRNALARDPYYPNAAYARDRVGELSKKY